MKVQDVIKLAASFIGEAEKVENYFLTNDADGKKATEMLLEYFNLVENELALDYLPLLAEDSLTTTTGRLEYSSLTQAAVRILSVKNSDGQSVEYTVYPKYLVAQPGKLVVQYTYTPKKKNFSEDGEYKLLASERLIAYGMAANYCFACGLYDEGEVWNKKYREAIAATYRSKPAKVIASRRWE